MNLREESSSGYKLILDNKPYDSVGVTSKFPRMKIRGNK